MCTYVTQRHRQHEAGRGWGWVEGREGKGEIEGCEREREREGGMVVFGDVLIRDCFKQSL